MADKSKPVIKSDGTKVYGTQGNLRKTAKDKNRQIVVIRKPNGSTTSQTLAAYKKEQSTGSKIPKGMEVDHKDNNRENNKASNLKVISKSENVAKGNKTRRK
ncbi:MAG: HNH endonuclease [Microbacteriaceae bacterium]|nr:HNH endonuclease [Microbacteriaceae bacterium]